MDNGEARIALLSDLIEATELFEVKRRDQVVLIRDRRKS